ncbi:MAG: hypothetical protein II992_13510 [Lachnospiraceae bacterium]|nr:hypothetical protein [Lachnospiraceae bacterium]MBQ6695993.1 hypothetical protein [Lachnospiraceae bacterium]
MNQNQAKKIIDTVVYETKKCHIFNADGSIDRNGINKLLPSELPNSISHILVGAEKKDGDITFEYDEETLYMYVPKELKEKIQFAVEYVFSEFDKINSGISDLALQFHIDRVANIANAEQVLQCMGYELTDIKKQTLIASRNDLGIALNQLSGNIKATIEYINGIPKDFKKRLFTVKVTTVLEKEKQAHMALMEYMKGIAIFCEMSLRLGDKDSAVSMLSRGKNFLDSFDIRQYERVEGWNQAKDMFWIRETGKYSMLLDVQLSKVNQLNQLCISMKGD